MIVVMESQSRAEYYEGPEASKRFDEGEVRRFPMDLV